MEERHGRTGYVQGTQGQYLTRAERFSWRRRPGVRKWKAVHLGQGVDILEAKEKCREEWNE